MADDNFKTEQDKFPGELSSRVSKQIHTGWVESCANKFQNYTNANEF